MVYNNPIIHGGPGSGRYPLGSGDRPYQHRGGFLSRRRQRKLEAKMAQARKRAMAKRSVEERQLMNEAQNRISQEEAKQRALSGGKAMDVLRFQGNLTNAELSSAVSRLESERRLKAMAKEEMEYGMRRFDDFMTKVGTYTKWVDTGINAWNDFAAIYNAFSEYGGMNSILRGQQTKKK